MEDLINFAISSYDIDYLTLLWKLTLSFPLFREKIQKAIPILAEKYSLGEVNSFRDLVEKYDGKLYEKAPSNKVAYFVEREDLIRLRYALQRADSYRLRQGMEKACLLGKKKFVDYLLDHGVKLSEGTTYSGEAARGGHLDLVQWLLSKGESIEYAEIASGAAAGGWRYILEWLFAQEEYEHNFESTSLVLSAAWGNQTEMVKWLYEQGYHGDEASVIEAVERENYDLARWLCEKGCSLSSRTFRAAASTANIEFMEWLHSIRCPWSWVVISNAGTLEACIWLHERGCPWNEHVTYYFAKHGEVALLEYAVKHGCPLHPECYQVALDEGMRDVVAWIESERK